MILEWKLGHYWTLRACIRDWQRVSLQTSNCSSCREGWMNEWVTNTITTSAQEMLIKCCLLALPRWQLRICALMDLQNRHSPGLVRNSNSWGPYRTGSSDHTKPHLFIAQKQKKASYTEGCQPCTSTSTQSFLDLQEGKKIWLFLIQNTLKSLKARKMGTPGHRPCIPRVTRCNSSGGPSKGRLETAPPVGDFSFTLLSNTGWI